MKFTIYALLFVSITAQIAAASTSGSKDYKRVSFDDFFAHQVVSIPLSIEIPSQYVRARALTVQATYSYWMKKDDVAAAVKSQNLPVRSGYLYGKPSPNEGYDQTARKFTSEDQVEDELAQAGMKLIERKRVEVRGFPMFSYIVQAKNGTVICSLFVATLVDTNVLYVSYRPPNNDLRTAKTVWNHILASIAENGQAKIR